MPANFPGFAVIQAAGDNKCLNIGIGDFSCHGDQIPGKKQLQRRDFYFGMRCEVIVMAGKECVSITKWLDTLYT